MTMPSTTWGMPPKGPSKIAFALTFNAPAFPIVRNSKSCASNENLWPGFNSLLITVAPSALSVTHAVSDASIVNLIVWGVGLPAGDMLLRTDWSTRVDNTGAGGSTTRRPGCCRPKLRRNSGTNKVAATPIAATTMPYTDRRSARLHSPSIDALFHKTVGPVWRNKVDPTSSRGAQPAIKPGLGA